MLDVLLMSFNRVDDTSDVPYVQPAVQPGGSGFNQNGGISTPQPTIVCSRRPKGPFLMRIRGTIGTDLLNYRWV